MNEDERDRAWLRAWSEGDSSAGDSLTVAYFLAIRQFMRRRCPDEFEDLVQQTFATLAEVKDNYRGEGSVRSFLFGIAYRIHLRHLDALTRLHRFDPLSSSLHDAYGRRPSSLIAASQGRQLFHDALQDISVANQDLLELYYWQGLSGEEIADALGIARGGVYRRLHDARGYLREAMEALGEPGIALTDADIQALLEAPVELDD